jgi:hypothetical protein
MGVLHVTHLSNILEVKGKGETKGKRGRLPSRRLKKESLFLEAEAEILLSLRKNVQGRDERDGVLCPD